MFDHLSSPLSIGNMTVRNRIAMSAMGVELAQEDGRASEGLIAYYEERARGGVGLIITEVAAVAYPQGANAACQIAISSDDYLPELEDLTKRVHAQGAKIALQLVHHGKQSRLDTKQGRQLLMPSKPRFHGAGDMASDLSREEIEWMMSATGGGRPSVKEADADDIAWLIEAFASAVDRARRAGFDGVEIHSAHGYILSEFLSPAWNFREDEYGGPIENRARLLCEVLEASKLRAGDDFPIWARLDSKEFRTPGGIEPDDCVRAAELAVEAGADAIHVTAYADATSAVAFTEGPLTHTENAYVETTARVKAKVDVPVIAVGRIEPKSADALVRDGKADMVAMARKLLADPALAQKIVEGRPEDIRPCIYCYTCVAQPFFDRPVRCAVNPMTANETTIGSAERETSATPKKVLVVGGGPAGMEAARMASLRGHDVVLCEKSAQLGGTLRFAGLVYEPNERLLDWLEAQVRKLGVEIRLSATVDAGTIREIAPDEVLLAAGASRAKPALPGVDQDHVFDGDDLRALLTGQGDGEASKKLSLLGRVAVRAGRAIGVTTSPGKLREASKAWMPVGKRVVVIGGGLVGLELAEFMAERGRQVTVLEEAPRFGLEMAHPRRWRALHEVRELGVELVARATVRSIGSSEVEYEIAGGEDGPVVTTAAADTVVLAIGLGPNTGLAETLSAAGVEVQSIGDVTGVGYIEGAMRDGFHAAIEL